MCYGDPERLLDLFVQANPLTPNREGRTAQDDFERFCLWAGLNRKTAGDLAVKWARFAYITAAHARTGAEFLPNVGTARGDPVRLLFVFLKATPLTKNAAGHTAQDDFEHFCSYAGLLHDSAGDKAVKWGQLAYITAAPRKLTSPLGVVAPLPGLQAD
jgi:hypothetical protein